MRCPVSDGSETLPHRRRSSCARRGQRRSWTSTAVAGDLVPVPRDAGVTECNAEARVRNWHANVDAKHVAPALAVVSARSGEYERVRMSADILGPYAETQVPCRKPHALIPSLIGQVPQAGRDLKCCPTAVRSRTLGSRPVPKTACPTLFDCIPGRTSSSGRTTP